MEQPTLDEIEDFINRIIQTEKTVAEVFNISQEDLYSDRKLRSHTDARSVLMYLLHDLDNVSYYRLSKLYDKHHSTLLRAVDKCKDLSSVDPNFNFKLHMCDVRR